MVHLVVGRSSTTRCIISSQSSTKREASEGSVSALSKIQILRVVYIYVGIPRQIESSSRFRSLPEASEIGHGSPFGLMEAGNRYGESWGP